MKTKTSELQGAALDWAVAKCEGYTDLHKIVGRMPHEPQLGIWPPKKEYGAVDLWELSFSTDWAQGRPNYISGGPTPLVAAMRCYVASKLGEEVEVPVGLV